MGELAGLFAFGLIAIIIIITIILTLRNEKRKSTFDDIKGPKTYGSINKMPYAHSFEGDYHIVKDTSTGQIVHKEKIK